MDSNQLMIALIGASSTLLAAWVNSRSKQKSNLAQTKRSGRMTVLKFGLYFLLGGAATYWVMDSLLPFSSIDERLGTLEMDVRTLGERTSGAVDSVSLGAFPVGSLILSTLPPDEFGRIPGALSYWAPADGKTVDTLSAYVLVTGRTTAPVLRTIRMTSTLSDSFSVVDSLHRIIPVTNARSGSDTAGGTALYWYIRIN